MKYLAIEAATINELNYIVNEKIKEGWKPVGGVSVTLSESDEYQYFMASQAMVTNNMSKQNT